MSQLFLLLTRRQKQTFTGMFIHFGKLLPSTWTWNSKCYKIFEIWCTFQHSKRSMSKVQPKTLLFLVYIMRMRICDLETRNSMPILKTHIFSLHDPKHKSLLWFSKFWWIFIKFNYAQNWHYHSVVWAIKNSRLCQFCA